MCVSNTRSDLASYFLKLFKTNIDLHWLPAPYRVQYKILLLVFRCLLGEAPEYLRSMIQPKRKGRHSLRSESAVLLEVPRVTDTPQLVDELSLLRRQTFGTNSLHSFVILNPSRPTSHSWRPIYLQQPSEITALENTQFWVIWALKNNYFDWLIDW
jgi:hypothetical protein